LLWQFWLKQTESLENKHEPWRLFTIEAVLIVCRSPKSRLVDHVCIAVNKDRLEKIAQELRNAPQRPLPEYAPSGKSHGETQFDFIIGEDNALTPRMDLNDPYKDEIVESVKAWLAEAKDVHFSDVSQA
jgi:hypothetical protein